MSVIQEFDLNMIPDSGPVVVYADQYDKGTGRLKISLYNGSSPYTPSGASVKIQGTKPDKKGFSYSASISGNVVTANLTEQMTAMPGRTRCNLVVTEGNNRTGTFIFWLEIQATGLSDEIDISETELPDYIDAAKRYADLAESYAIGTNGRVRINDGTDNAKYYSEQAQKNSGGNGSGSSSGSGGSGSEGGNNYVNEGLITKLFSKVVGNTLTFTSDILENNVLVSGPFIADTYLGVKNVSQSGVSITFILTNDTADGKGAYILVAAADEEIKARTLSYIRITTPPTRTNYNEGENLDLSGITVIATYSDETIKNVTSLCTFLPSNGVILSETGAKNINVSYTEGGVTKIDSTIVTVAERVEEPARTLVSVTRAQDAPDKKHYRVGEAITFADYKFIATWSDGSEEEVPILCACLSPIEAYSYLLIDKTITTTSRTGYRIDEGDIITEQWLASGSYRMYPVYVHPVSGIFVTGMAFEIRVWSDEDWEFYRPDLNPNA